MNAPARAITLPTPLPYLLPSIHAVHGPREAGKRLRLALFWATQNFTAWHDACDGRHFDLVLPSLAAPRLEENLANGGVALVRIESNVLRFLQIEPGAKLILEQPLPVKLDT